VESLRIKSVRVVKNRTIAPGIMSNVVEARIALFAMITIAGIVLEILKV
jgi:hypothetical protein